MEIKLYEVIDACTHKVIASCMELDTALVLIEAMCNKYYATPAYLTLKEMGQDKYG